MWGWMVLLGLFVHRECKHKQSRICCLRAVLSAESNYKQPVTHARIAEALNHRRRSGGPFMNLAEAELWLLHGATLAQLCWHWGAHVTGLPPSSCASFGKQQEMGLQVITTAPALTVPQTQQYPERQYFSWKWKYSSWTEAVEAS